MEELSCIIEKNPSDKRKIYKRKNEGHREKQKKIWEKLTTNSTRLTVFYGWN